LFPFSERFDMSYVDENGNKARPYIIHRTSIGCYERTIALLIEKFAGAFPVWLSPTQVKVLSLTDRTAQNAKDVAEKMQRHGIRAEYDIRNEKLGYKIREAQLEKTPYIVIIGDKEAQEGTLSVRRRKTGDLGVMTYDEFIKRIDTEIEDKILD